jgi:MATE family multidrug resistance protein
MAESGTYQDLKIGTGHRDILSMALPISMAILIPQVNMLCNNIFLGQLSTETLGDAGVTSVFYLIFAVAGHGLNNAMQSVFSLYAGMDDTGKFKQIISQGVRISIQLSLLFILFTIFCAPSIFSRVAMPESYPREISFLRIRILGLPFLYLFQMGNAFLIASLNSRLLIIGFVIEAGCNILLDYLLIFGHWGMPALGFNGAAVASVIAECVGMITVFGVIHFSGLSKSFGLFKTWKRNSVISKQITSVAFPLMLQFIISLATWLVFFFLIETKGEQAKAISNTMRNVFGLAGIFIWAFSGTCNNMVSNLIGQGLQHQVIPLIKKITLWSFGLCLVMVLALNLFPGAFFNMFNQNASLAVEGIPVIRVVTMGMILMSISNVWLNAVTGTGKTKVNLVIEIVAVALYLGYTYYFMKLHYINLAMAWSNEFVYWSLILLMSSAFILSKKWMTHSDKSDQ